MLLRDLKKVWISKAVKQNDHGEVKRIWQFVSTAFLNLQQDINELDKKSTGEVNYDIYKARTDRKYNIPNGSGISFEDISEKESFVPEYRVLDQSEIGSTYLYRMERYYGD